MQVGQTLRSVVDRFVGVLVFAAWKWLVSLKSRRLVWHRCLDLNGRRWQKEGLKRPRRLIGVNALMLRLVASIDRILLHTKVLDKLYVVTLLEGLSTDGSLVTLLSLILWLHLWRKGFLYLLGEGRGLGMDRLLMLMLLLLHLRGVCKLLQRWVAYGIIVVNSIGVLTTG